MHNKIAIIGGGIAGLATAIALKQNGLNATVYERSAALAEGGAGLSLWPNATGILVQMGLLDHLIPVSNILREVHSSTCIGKRLNDIDLGKLEQEFGYPSLILLRRQLLEVLSQAVEPAQIVYGKECSGIGGNPMKPEVRFGDGSSIQADIVLFCDGVHSRARRDVFGYGELVYAGRTSWRGVCAFDEPRFDRKINREIFGVGKRIGLFTLDERTAYWFAVVNMPEAYSRKQQRSFEGLMTHFSEWADPVREIFSRTPPEKMILTNIVYSPEVKELVRGRYALLGDAAHPMTPDLGQGACQAIEDAWILAKCLSASKDPDQGLAAYRAKRLARVRGIVGASARMGIMRQMDHRLGFWLRNAAMRVMPKKPVLAMLAKNIRF